MGATSLGRPLVGTHRREVALPDLRRDRTGSPALREGDEAECRRADDEHEEHDAEAVTTVTAAEMQRGQKQVL
jgi:hypothetical protein